MGAGILDRCAPLLLISATTLLELLLQLPSLDVLLVLLHLESGGRLVDGSIGLIQILRIVGRENM